MSFASILDEHPALSRRRERSHEQLMRVRHAFGESAFFHEKRDLAIFCAGSLARMELGDKSDLDVFVTANRRPELKSRLLEYNLFSELIRINEGLGLPPFSNDGEYLKIYFIDDLRDSTGSRHDDSENRFTARMLLMLESQPIHNEELYREHLRTIVANYYRDEKGKRSFKPLFLLNDLLRYWRTLCLNYEERRHEPRRPWRKKNVNLKFSRMVTVFATVLPLVDGPHHTCDEVEELCEQRPLGRLARALDALHDSALERDWRDILDCYEAFLSWKEDDDVDGSLRDYVARGTVAEYAERLSTFLYRALTNDRIPFEFRRYLIL